MLLKTRIIDSDCKIFFFKIQNKNDLINFYNDIENLSITLENDIQLKYNLYKK